MIDVVADTWPRDLAHSYEAGRRGSWDVVTLRGGESSRQAVLEWGEDELYRLRVARCVLMEFASQETDKVEVLRDQLARAREYVDGTALLVEVSLGPRVIRQSIIFSDGEMAVWRLSLVRRIGTRLRAGWRHSRREERRVSA